MSHEINRYNIQRDLLNRLDTLIGIAHKEDLDNLKDISDLLVTNMKEVINELDNIRGRGTK